MPLVVKGLAYQTSLQVSGGRAPYTWKGTPPPGLTLSPSGVISGHATQLGKTAPQISVTASVGTLSASATRDAAAPAATTTQTVTTSAAVSFDVVPVAITTTSLPDGYAGRAYSQTLSAQGGTLPYTWSVSAGALPPGLDLDAATGTLSGTPTAHATYSFSVTVTDSSSTPGKSTSTFALLVGPTWRPSALPLPADAARPLAGENVTTVGCSSAHLCVALGAYVTSGSSVQGVLWSETGGTWVATRAPLPPDAARLDAFSSYVYASCTDAFCLVASQYYDTAGVTRPLVWTFDGSTWADSRPPLPADGDGTQDVTANGFACAGSNCAGAGYYRTTSGARSGVLWAYSAGVWTATEAIPAGQSDFRGQLFDVACTLADLCFVAESYPSGNTQNAVEWTYASGVWAATDAVREPDVAPTGGTNVGAAACDRAGDDCVDSGDYPLSGGGSQAMLWDFTANSWHQTVAPLPADAATAPRNSFARTGSACSNDGCVTVGGFTVAGAASNSSAIAWTHTTQGWSATELPTPPDAAPASGDAVGIACADDSCVVSGQYADGQGNTAVELLTNRGGSWVAARAQLPADAATNAQVEVDPPSCTATYCAVLGTYTTINNGHGAVFWDTAGGTWNTTEVPGWLTGNLNGDVIAPLACGGDECGLAHAWQNATSDSRLLSFAWLLS